MAYRHRTPPQHAQALQVFVIRRRPNGAWAAISSYIALSVPTIMQLGKKPGQMAFTVMWFLFMATHRVSDDQRHGRVVGDGGQHRAVAQSAIKATLMMRPTCARIMLLTAICCDKMIAAH
jgi:hypothetical protein